MAKKDKSYYDAVNGYVEAIFPQRRHLTMEENLAAAIEKAKTKSPQYQKGFRSGLQERDRILEFLREKKKQKTKSSMK